MEFDFESMTEAELQAFDEKFLDYMRELELQSVDKVRVLNSARMQQVSLAYALLKCLAKRTGAETSYKVCEPFTSMASISMEGENLTFGESKYFNRIMEVADNMEVYPLTKNRVRLDFTFYHMTIAEE